MKNTIARKVARQVTLLLFIALIILFLGAWHTVSSIVSGETDRKAETILDIYCEYLYESSIKKQIPIDTDHTEDAVRIGDYLCEHGEADFLYLYTISDEHDAVTYICASFSSNTAEKDPGDHMIGRYIEAEIIPEELAVWNGTANDIHLDLNNSYGHEYTTLRLIEDCFGNKLIAGVDVSYDAVMQQITRASLLLAATVIIVLLGVDLAVSFILRKRVSKPAQKISRSMQDYLRDGKRNSVILDTGGPDEYAMIASAFNSMSGDIDRYVESIRDLTREQEGRKTELDIAAAIQRGFLPDAKKDWKTCAVRAMMSPAKDVGGDLYDYLQMDDGRILMVIADVSGKGVAAAIMMAVALMLIREYAKMGLEPHEILQKTNNTLTEKNPRMLFVTAFVGIYDPRRQCLTYSNAGHNIPYAAGAQLRPLDGARGTILGIYQSEAYFSESVSLLPGDFIFLYTDGITEAVNAGRAFFGEARLEQALRDFRFSRGDDPVSYVYDAVRAFVGEAEQFDDITMLALTVKNSVSLALSYDAAENEKIREEILKLPVSRTQQLNLCLAAEEIFVNICSYAFDGAVPERETIDFSLSVSDHIELCFSDGGRPYNPLEQITSAEDYDSDHEIGGLGKLLAVSLTDEASYEYLDGKNRLTLIKYFEEDPE